MQCFVPVTQPRACVACTCFEHCLTKSTFLCCLISSEFVHARSSPRVMQWYWSFACARFVLFCDFLHVMYCVFSFSAGEVGWNWRAQGFKVSWAGSMACLDIWKNDGVEITTNDRRTRSTSSYVTFLDIERLIGDDAKRLIDHKLADPFDQSDMELWSFKALSDASCKQMI